ncbi:MAG: DUF475 domain-containing protein [Candidatus Pacebacteria bacterium]|nr:DUF475 domain-containing protein [Candidatus Paceibacterota bacterium]
MSIVNTILIILGLAVFEIVSSVDNAVINAEVLSTMSPKARRWFMIWGFLFAVIMVRGLLPWVIIWATNPTLGPIGSFMATFSSDPLVAESIARSAPLLLAGGGVFLVFLFLHWLFLEPKTLGLRHEKFFMKQGVWFYGVAAIILSVVVWYGLKTNPIMAFGAVIGSTTFFIMHGFKENAEKAEQDLKNGNTKKSDLSKIFYLEVIDASFSIDGVLGAFAFTLSVPWILIGNGIGAFVLRELTIKNIETIKKYKFLKNGAMYAIGALSFIMILGAFGHHVPEWISPIVMMSIVGYFFWKSKMHNKLAIIQ